MKRLVLLLLLLSSACFAQIDHGGLTIPGDGAVQVVKKSGPLTAPPYRRDGLVIEFLAQNYDFATGSVAVWPNTGSLGGNATQATEVNKPMAYDPVYQRVTFNSLSTTGIKVGMSYDLTTLNAPYTVVVAGVIKYQGDQRAIWSGTSNNPRFDNNPGSLFFYTRNAAVTVSVIVPMPAFATGTFALRSLSDGNCRTYKDGAVVVSASGAGASTPLQGGVLAIGDYTMPPTANAATFHLCCYCVWNKALTDSEVAAIHSAIASYYGAGITDTTGLP